MKNRNDKVLPITRRHALQAAIALAGGSIALSRLAPLARAAAAAEQSAPRFLSGRQLAVVARAVDIIIPATETPGALGVGVHRFIDLMLADWANDRSRALLTLAVEQIDESARRAHGKTFVELDESRQFALLETIDRDAFDNTSDDAPYRMLKWLTLLGYYSSEVGASVELRFNPIPGPSPGCVPLEDIGRAWYKHGGF